jgi:hypothetical protein
MFGEDFWSSFNYIPKEVYARARALTTATANFIILIAYFTIDRD